MINAKKRQTISFTEWKMIWLTICCTHGHIWLAVSAKQISKKQWSIVLNTNIQRVRKSDDFLFLCIGSSGVHYYHFFSNFHFRQFFTYITHISLSLFVRDNQRGVLSRGCPSRLLWGRAVTLWQTGVTPWRPEVGSRHSHIPLPYELQKLALACTWVACK